MNKQPEIDAWLRRWIKTRRLMLERRWFTVDKVMQVYLRVHPIPVSTIDVATVEVKKAFRGQGRFKAFLSWLEQCGHEKGYQRIRLENVIGERLCAYYLSVGYTLIEPVGDFPCFEKWLTQEEK